MPGAKGTTVAAKDRSAEMSRAVREATDRLGVMVFADRAHEVLMSPGGQADFRLCSDWVGWVMEQHRRDTLVTTRLLVKQLSQAVFVLDRIESRGSTVDVEEMRRVRH